VSTTTALGIGYAAVFFALATAIWRARPTHRTSKRRRAAAARERIIRESLEARGYISPHDPRLPAWLDKRLDDYAALDPDLAPVFTPGLDRLRQAIRDEQQKGEQA
jgi:hypothetical protein